MANKKTVIDGSNNISARQLKDFFRQIDEGIITGTLLQNFLEDSAVFKARPPRFGKGDIPKLVKLINGNRSSFVIEVKDYICWDDLLFFAINQFRVWAESIKEPGFVQYYKECWDKFDAAKNVEDKIEAIRYLALSIDTD